MIGISASGSAYEVGRQRGAALAGLIPRTLELLLARPVDPAGLADVRAVIERSFPRVLEEAEGLAAGAGIDAERALAVSVSADLTGRLPAYCSLIATGGAVVKNLDTEPAMGPLQVVETLAFAGARAFAHLTTAGAAWTDGGVNERGLALVNASLAAARPNPAGLPDGIVARELLAACDDVDAAVEFLAGHDFRTFGENVLLADASGAVAVVEKLPHGSAVRRGAAAAACNHVLEPALERELDPADPIAANSRRRMRLLEPIRAGAAPGPDALLALFQDPAGGIHQDGDAALWTVATLVLEPAARRLRLVTGAVAPLDVAVPSPSWTKPRPEDLANVE